MLVCAIRQSPHIYIFAPFSGYLRRISSTFSLVCVCAVADYTWKVALYYTLRVRIALATPSTCELTFQSVWTVGNGLVVPCGAEGGKAEELESVGESWTQGPQAR